MQTDELVLKYILDVQHIMTYTVHTVRDGDSFCYNSCALERERKHLTHQKTQF